LVLTAISWATAADHCSGRAVRSGNDFALICGGLLGGPACANDPAACAHGADGLR
jgi:hypothetical protein